MGYRRIIDQTTFPQERPTSKPTKKLEFAAVTVPYGFTNAGFNLLSLSRVATRMPLSLSTTALPPGTENEIIESEISCKSNSAWGFLSKLLAQYFQYASPRTGTISLRRPFSWAC